MNPRQERLGDHLPPMNSVMKTGEFGGNILKFALITLLGYTLERDAERFTDNVLSPEHETWYFTRRGLFTFVRVGGSFLMALGMTSILVDSITMIKQK
jgi:hypothetical protein